MKAVAEVIGIARSSLCEQMKKRPHQRVGRPPAPADALVAEIKGVIADLPTYGYRRVHAILRRKALAEGRQPPNHKRVYRVMRSTVSCSSAMQAGRSGVMTAGSPSRSLIGAGARMASRSAVTTASGSVSLLPSTAVTARP